MKYCTSGKVYLYIQSFLKWSLSLSFSEYQSIPGSRAIFIYDWKMIQNATLQEKDQMVGLETRTWFQSQHLKQNNLQVLPLVQPVLHNQQRTQWPQWPKPVSRINAKTQNCPTLEIQNEVNPTQYPDLVSNTCSQYISLQTCCNNAKKNACPISDCLNFPV